MWVPGVTYACPEASGGHSEDPPAPTLPRYQTVSNKTWVERSLFQATTRRDSDQRGTYLPNIEIYEPTRIIRSPRALRARAKE